MPNTLTISPERVHQISEIASSYIQEDKAILAQFINRYYQSLHSAVADTISDVDLAGMALHHYTLVKQYDGQQPSLCLLNPSAEEQHFHSTRTVIQMVAYDRPFLVDTMSMCIEAQGLEVHRIYNTILDVQRDEHGQITAIESAEDSDTRHLSLIHCEIDRIDAQELATLRQALLDKVATLDCVVADWGVMQDRLAQIKEELKGQQLPEAYHTSEEIQAFLEWVMNDNFIFLGFREYRLENGDTVKEGSEAHLKDELNLISVGGSGLGILKGGSEDTRSVSYTHLTLPTILRV